MTEFLHWLRRADARQVFAVAMLALLLTLGGWVWKVMAPVEREVFQPQGTKDKGSGDLGILGFLEKQIVRDVAVPENPFKQAAQKKAPEPLPKGGTPAPTPTPKPPPVQLTYKGLLQKTDGTVVAWVESSVTKRSAFFAIGQEIQGCKIGRIERDTLELTRSDGSSLTLQARKPTPIEEVRGGR